MSEAFPFFVTGIEEVGGGVGGVVSAVGANIEGFGWDREPCEISDHYRQSCQPGVFPTGQAGESIIKGAQDTFLSYEALPASGQADHDDADSCMVDCDAFPIGFLISDHCGENVGAVAVIDVPGFGLL